MSKSQVNAVIEAICTIREQDSFDEAVKLTDKELLEVTEMVTIGVLAKEVDFSESAWNKHDTEEKVTSYIKSMVKNHLKKCKKLNGNITYEYKNPGSRANRGDAQVTNMRALKAKLIQDGADDDLIAQTDTEINKRLAELKAKSQKPIEINYDILPESLKDLVG